MSYLQGGLPPEQTLPRHRWVTPLTVPHFLHLHLPSYLQRPAPWCQERVAAGARPATVISAKAGAVVSGVGGGRSEACSGRICTGQQIDIRIGRWTEPGPAAVKPAGAGIVIYMSEVGDGRDKDCSKSLAFKAAGTTMGLGVANFGMKCHVRNYNDKSTV